MTKTETTVQNAVAMNKVSSKNVIEAMLNGSGIVINGTNPWDIQIHNDNFYNRLIHEGVLGLGESYMDQWWDCPQLDLLFYKVLKAKLDDKVHIPFHLKLKILLARVINFQTKKLSQVVGRKHYDLGNELFQLMLDPHMNYSCGYWKNARTLNEAQEAKLDLICQKLHLKPGMRLLDVGCGWGGLAKYAAEKYQVNVVGITISQQQFNYAKNYCQGLPIEIRLQDYRDVNTSFDRIVSVGMFEHVGHLNYATYMRTLHRVLKDDGFFLLHTIGGNHTSLFTNEWIAKYIFPNGMVPSITQIGRVVENLFVMEDWHNFGVYYDATLMAWYENFVQHWEVLKHHYDERFYRMWTYYLLSCAGSFRARANQLWQVVLSKNGIANGYIAPR